MTRISCGVIIASLTMLVAMPAFSQSKSTAQKEKKPISDPIRISGKVIDAITNVEITNAKVYRYDAHGNVADSTSTGNAWAIVNGEKREMSYFAFPVERKDSVYTFDIMCPGYQTETIVFPVENVGKRERGRQIPVIRLKREAKKLGEVTVTASKVKFYNKGDTLVFNADAFQLAEGSMLDALIAQLPGVELNEKGEIRVNGEYVETLLLNGRDFFQGDNKIMLENIGAYTVKNVEVYKGQTHLEKWRNDPNAEKHLTMDVKLKKEYSMGWIINAQGAAGTKERYMGRLFASWFTPTTNITLLGNFNNLNDNRQPGKNDSWTPEMMPSGTKRYKMASMNYDYHSVDDNRRASGYVKFEGSIDNHFTTTNRTNFLSGGDTYDNSFSQGRNSDIKLETRNYATVQRNKWYWWHMALGRYIKRDNKSAALSASFNKEQSDITAKALEALYSDSSPERLDAIINRSISKNESDRREWEIQFYPTYNYKVPGTDDILRIQAGIKYQNRKDDEWRDYNINYGSDPVPAEVRRQYFDNSPLHTITFDGTIDYTARIRDLSLYVVYSYRFSNKEENSSMYALDQLADMGIFGTLPEGYLSTFDPANSFKSRKMQNKHDLSPGISWRYSSSRRSFFINFAPLFSIDHQNLNYRRNNKTYPEKRTSFIASSGKYNLSTRYHFRPILIKDNNSQKYNHRGYVNELQYILNFDTKTPDLMHLIDIEDDTNPLNISLGNPNLKNAFTQRHDLSWKYTPAGKYVNNRIAVGYETTKNALVRGYTYNTTTGVRYNRTYNVNGNSSFRVSNSFNIQFGNKQQFTLSSMTSGSVMRYADMIGVDMEEPTKSTVKSNLLNENISFSWQFGKQNIQIRGNFTNRHTTSTREDFNAINANHINYGIIGQFKLPAGFGISTDFTMYTRDGYGSRQLDTTDAIWNLQLSYTPQTKGRHWVFMLDSFDLLHNLSNVNYAVNASGRTVSYSNALPRYVLLSVQYRLNLQPKKR